MLMTRKKRIKIAKLLAEIEYIAMTDLSIKFDSFEQIQLNVLDLTTEIGGFSMLIIFQKCLDELKKRCDADTTDPVKLEHNSLCETETYMGE